MSPDPVGDASTSMSRSMVSGMDWVVVGRRELCWSLLVFACRSGVVRVGLAIALTPAGSFRPLLLLAWANGVGVLCWSTDKIRVTSRTDCCQATTCSELTIVCIWVAVESGPCCWFPCVTLQEPTRPPPFENSPVFVSVTSYFRLRRCCHHRDDYASPGGWGWG